MLSSITIIECLLPPKSYRCFRDFYEAFQQNHERGLSIPPDISGRWAFIRDLLQIYAIDLMGSRDIKDDGSYPEDVAQIIESINQIMPAPVDLNFEERLTGVISAMNLLFQLNQRVPYEAGIAAEILSADANDGKGKPQEIDLLPTDRFAAVFTVRMQDLREKVETVLSGGTLVIFQPSA